MKVVVNAGHTFETPGKASCDGKLKEWEWNLLTAQLTVRSLIASGIDAELVRATKESDSLTLPVKRTNELCSKYGKKNVLFISIHCNAAGMGKQWMSARGWSIWTTVGQTESDVLATCIYHGAERAFADDKKWGLKLRKDMRDGDVDYEKNYYVLRNTACPAVLIENFFMDNKEDCAFLLSDESKAYAAEAIVQGVEEYLKMKNKE